MRVDTGDRQFTEGRMYVKDCIHQRWTLLEVSLIKSKELVHLNIKS